MTLKFVFVAALCVSQGFAIRILNKHPKEGLYKKPFSREFEKTLHELDKIRQIVSTAAMDAYFEGNDIEVVFTCFNQQREKYIELGQKIAGMITKDASELVKKFGETYGKYAQRLLREISETIKELPGKVWTCIKKKKFIKALAELEESYKIVEENAEILDQIFNEMVDEIPEAAEEVEKMALEVRRTASKECRSISADFRQCVKDGGPKNHISDVEFFI